MTSLNISLPDPLKAYVEDRVASGDYGTPSEFVRNLIRQDKEQRSTRIETELLDALQTKNLKIAPEELKGRSLVAVLREKLARS
jgi:antitoxin ParD1/3/4